MHQPHSSSATPLNLFPKNPKQNIFQTHLLHGSGRGRGTSRRYPDPRRSPRKWAGTGLCCPIWACRPPLLPPSSPAAHERGSGRPCPDSGISTSSSFFTFFPSAPLIAEMNSRCVWPSGKKQLFVFISVNVYAEGAVSAAQLSLSRSFSPTARPWKRDRVIYCDLWHFNRSYQWLMTVLFELCNVSYFKKVHQSLKLLIHYTKQSCVIATPSSPSSPQQHHFPEIFVIYFWGSVMIWMKCIFSKNILFCVSPIVYSVGLLRKMYKIDFQELFCSAWQKQFINTCITFSITAYLRPHLCVCLQLVWFRHMSSHCCGLSAFPQADDFNSDQLHFLSYYGFSALT